MIMGTHVRKPVWLRRGIPRDPASARLRSLLEDGRLHTVCREARCPNCGECFARGTATFLILGNLCTRGCRFCAVSRGNPAPPDPDEPHRVAEAAARLALGHVVVTSVTRDDLADGGAGAFAETIRALRTRLPASRIEVLIPDFRGDDASLRTVIEARPDVLNHNLETVARLYPEVRPQAVYGRSLALLRRASLRIALKSGMMLGLGERPAEVEEALRDLSDAGCRILTLGQYLQPGKECLPVARYIPSEEFVTWRNCALGMGFERVASGPLVRSSYHAEEICDALPGTGEGS
ncbi:MAG: lipoyl synthase [Proteobacteria bacterium]|nr:lipoyl synthase [Pseudomonadota bacterium]MBU2261952.1 lipoyl synthase [Pseudomonadota bacterium]